MKPDNMDIHSQAQRHHTMHYNTVNKHLGKIREMQRELEQLAQEAQRDLPKMAMEYRVMGVRMDSFLEMIRSSPYESGRRKDDG